MQYRTKTEKGKRMLIFGTESKVEIPNDLDPVKVESITGHVFNRHDGELHIKTSIGSLCIELNEEDTQKLFREVNAMTGLFGGRITTAAELLRETAEKVGFKP